MRPPNGGGVEKEKYRQIRLGGGQDVCQVAINFRFIHVWMDSVSREEPKK